MTFIDDHTVLLSYNQQQPRNIVVQKSTDGGLTYSPVSAIAAPNPDFPGPMRYDPVTSHIVVHAVDEGRAGQPRRSRRTAATTWTDCKVAAGDTVTRRHRRLRDRRPDRAGNVYVAWAD